MSRKGQAGVSSNLVTIIVAIVVAMSVMGIIYFTFGPRAVAKTGQTLCESSVHFKGQYNPNVKLGDTKARLSSQLKCETQRHFISGTNAQEQLAGLMAQCWKQFGEGKYARIFEGSGISLRNQKTNECFVCSSAYLEKGVTSFTSQDFLTTLRTKKQQVKKGQDSTYLNYIQFGGGKTGPGRIALLTADFKPESAYAVVFVSRNEQGATIADSLINFFGSAGKSVAHVLCNYGACTPEFAKKFYQGKYSDASIVAVDTLQSAQEHCMVGNLAGGASS